MTTPDNWEELLRIRYTLANFVAESLSCKAGNN